MIRVKTVFVLGAGASVPYGMPSGGKLLEMAQALDLKNFATKLGERFSISKLSLLRDAINNCQDLSIDALLEHRPEIQDTGRELIASLLLESERNSHSRYKGIEQDWFRYLWNEMSSDTLGIEGFEENRVSFITYNYDRLLEQKLMAGLSRYPSKGGQRYRALKSIPIIHLHGSLGELPDFSNRGGIPFGLKNHSSFEEGLKDHLQNSSASIHVIHSANPKNENFTNARQLLAGADQIFFLGFGFGGTNVSRLNVRRIRKDVPIVCGAFDLTTAEKNEMIQRPFLSTEGSLEHKLDICDSYWDCKRVLCERLTLLRRAP